MASVGGIVSAAHHPQIVMALLSSSSGLPESNSPAVRYSLNNGWVFESVMKNPTRYSLDETDKLLLQDGRESLVRHTRYGFLLGAVLSPLPLFRGEYALNNLSKLPPLMDRVTQRPNPVVVRARMWWVGKSVLLTTLGSGLGAWIGFTLGLKSLEQKLNSMPGCRERVIAAITQARREFESSHNPLASDRAQEISNPSSATSFSLEDHVFDDNHLTSSPSLAHPAASSAPSVSTSKTSKWEELRKAPSVQPSAWDSIRKQHTKPNTSPHTSELSNLTSPESFEALLERERNISAGISTEPRV
ncbi:hypothetical protein O181_023699 [Austropuccinia psidii MF-1]|uniref:Uncharacterized protein n=1 Tax=Austropuccinia psidii MF-1 TaxID=1389203 RepID=A0A9Q3GYX5_9BASI|nr:hypothetical protein [Austropuccinia psidii MF-1]